MTSSRLPGKVLKEVLGKSLLEYQIERLKRVVLADDVVIATTTNYTDQSIVDLCVKLDVSCFRGSEIDVLSRYYEAAMIHQACVVVRITSDCPLIDPKIVDYVIKEYLDNKDKVDFVSNSTIMTYPRGMDVEVFSTGSLCRVNQLALDSVFREHVTLYFERHPDKFTIMNIANEHNLRLRILSW